MIRTLACALVALLVLMAGCATPSTEIADPPRVEVLRLKITKVRNAIQETRSTIAQSRGATYLPELYLRLGELLSEEARYHYQLAYEREGRSSRIMHVPQVRLLKNDAIGVYKLILNRFPDSPVVPRAMFNLGHEYRELGDFDEMRTPLQRLVAEYPKHPLAYDALLVLGDYYFDQNDMGEAKHYYEQIAKADLNHASGLGRYKLAWVRINQGDCKAAIGDFESAIELTNAWLDGRGTGGAMDVSGGRGEAVEGQDIEVRREALVDLTYCYTQEKKARHALDYFRKRAYTRAAYVAALDKLASRYRLQSNDRGVVLVTRRLLELAPANAERIEDARSLYTSLKKRKAYDEVDRDMERISNALTRYYSQIGVEPPERDRLRSEFELYMRDLVTRAQTEMKSASGNKKRRMAQAAARGYAVYAQTFPQADKLPEMLLNMAETLDAAGQKMAAGQRALEAADLIAARGDDPKPKADEADEAGADTDDEPTKSAGQRHKEALYDAVVYFQESLGEVADRGHYERVTARAQLRRAGEQLLRYELAADKARQVKFAIAQSYFDEGRYDAAIDRLTAVAYEFPQTDEADAAVQLVLESYNTLNDFDGLIWASRQFMSDDSPASKSLRADIADILDSAEQGKLDQLSLAAAGDGGGDLSPLMNFAERHEGSRLGERALVNAFVAARAMGDSQKMYVIADQIASKYPDSEQLPGMYSSLAKSAISRFEYDKAVDILTKAASVNEAQRVQLLVSAGGLLEEMGQLDRARDLYRQAIEAGEGAARAPALASYAALLERTSDPNKILGELGPYADTGQPDVLARLGLAQVALGQVMDAETTLGIALQTAEGASPEAHARAQYGMAEVLFQTLKQYPALEDVMLLQEFITLVEVTQQSYLNAAQQGSRLYTPMALSRMAHALNFAADKIQAIDLPAELSAAERKQVQAAVDARAESLKTTAAQALSACAGQAWNNHLFNEVVEQCVAGKPFAKTLSPYATLERRSGGVTLEGADDLRQRLSKNPEDAEALVALGTKLLDAGDAHAARLAFAQAVQSGAGANAFNLLGIASYRVGDHSGAFEAFARAAEGGLEVGRTNLRTMLERLGSQKMADQVNEHFPAGEAGGRTLNGAKRGR